MGRGIIAAVTAVLLLTAPAVHARQAPAPAQPSVPAAPAPTATPAPPDQSAGPEISQFLATTPVTLLDWGMMRLERDLDRAMRRLQLDRTRGEAPRAGTLFRFQDRRVLVYFSTVATDATRTEEGCRELFTALREELLAGAPNGPEGAQWYLSRLFGSDAWRGRDRPEPFGPRVVDMVLLEVTLRPPPADAFAANPGKIACAGRLDAEVAYIVPPPPKPQG
jgi:hypothetical protein